MRTNTKHNEEDSVPELGFFAVLSHRNMESKALLLSRPLPGGMTVGTASLNGWIKCFADTQVLHDEAGEVIIVLYGHICGDVSLSQFINAYKTQGELAVDLLNGSFALLLIDKLHDQIVWATDRVCSRKIYVRQQESIIVVSTVLKYLFTDGLSLDPVGLAWYFSNGVFHNNRTMFEGISIAARASCYTFYASRPVQVQSYWQYLFTNEYAHKTLASIKEEFEGLLVESVRKRVDEQSMNLLSLSAGYDSPGVLGILSKRLGVDRLWSFSHGLNEDDEESDAYLARRLAEMCGIAHQFFSPYDGDLCGAVERNALWGNGVAHFCDESLLWSVFYDEYAGQNCTLFVADECFGGIGRNTELFSNEDILSICKIREFTCLNWLKRFLSHDTYRAFLEGQQEDVMTLFTRVPYMNDIYDVKDWFYLDQRISCVHMPWREYFSGRTFRVQNPFLDNDVLDFVRKLPSQWRRSKRLYKETIASMFPEIFAVKRATVGGFIPDSVWTEDMRREKELLLARYLTGERSSLLDAFITPDSIVRLFALEVEIPDKVSPVVDRIISLPYRAVNKVLRKVRVNEIRRRKKFVLGRTTFLLRYLVLRRFLEIAERDSVLFKLKLEMEEVTDG